ncbi:glutamyl-tRNA reductase [Enterococcus sp. PF1-24]|uniref:glutamyl-tRNA reductase n=1 Tax=unclassified Enterococcus TaxID=2608891 RepID=UPI0024755776|nr:MULTISPECIES: glutamyl-tRNA reductase [unclassified Enterococcus]MDH6363373.1 glutamyl-tRNA reductase [Enterococcus sp. PFB1-1]MDH6400326.1 glutamyl-tRNA reductase [Enterococcus sp. PF1-24]
MYLLAVGLTYKHTPVKLREKTAIAENQLLTINQQLNLEKSILENIILSTCNRTEIFAVVDQIHTGKYYIKHFLAKTFQLSMEQLEPYLEFYENQAAVNHYFRLICGLDSMVVGETQILGQMRGSFLTAQSAGTTGTIFNHLFPDLIHFAKEMHTQYRINDHSSSLSQSALQIAKDKLGSLHDKRIFILGAGEMSELLVKNLQNFQVGEVHLFNRTLSKIENFAKEISVPCYTHALADFYQEVAQADVVISALGVNQPYIIKKQLAQPLAEKNGQLLLIDLGVPRNVDAHCTLIEGVTLCDIDQMNQLIQVNQQARLQSVTLIEAEISKAVTDFFQWENQLGIIPLVKELRLQTLAAEEAAMASLLRKLPDLKEREIKVIRKHMKSIVNQTLRTPIKEIKEMAIQEDAQHDIAVVKRIFGLEKIEEGKTEDEN